MNKEETVKEIVKYYPTYYDVVERLLFIQQENNQLQAKIDKSIEELTLLIDIGFDYDGYNDVENLKQLIDELVSYARESRKILKGEW